VVDVCGACNDMYEHLWDFGYYTTVWIDTIARIHKSCRILSSPWAMPDVEAATMQISFLWFTHVEAPAIVSMLMDRNVGLIDICS
jgi:hypothetical protein